ncbi:MAG: chemotaxis protein CheB [Kastovskya adunca ATA6-11-RM4]|jgi:two-component system chemotaxis response regulator CheB|nr:chemotaxis protein CheB [Kastovskya adunca ATA6-11-RM4]
MQGKIIVVGASAGGVEVLTKLVAGLSPDLPATIFVVLHVSPNGTSVLPKILNRAGPLEAMHAKQGEVFQPGRIYIAPPDYHLLIKKGHMQLTRGPKENSHRPAIDPLFRTAARAYGSQVIGVVLSGMLDDGTAGLSAVKERGGIAIVQNPDEALFSDMPRSAIENVEVDLIVPVAEMGAALVHFAHKPVKEQELAPVSKEMEMEADIAELKPDAVHSDERPGTPSNFACPDCGGVLWELGQNNLIRFRCRTGHAFSAESLLAKQSEALEEALWTALRALEETAVLRRRMAKRASQMGNSARAQSYEEQAISAEQRGELIRQTILSSINSNSNDGKRTPEDRPH